MIKKVYWLLIEIFSKNIKICFENPPQKNLIVYDKMSLNVSNFFFSKLNFFLLETRYENLSKIYITPIIFFLFLKNLKCGNIFCSYLLALIEIVKPNVLITLTDNDLRLPILKKQLEKNVTFFCIQSANRYQYLYYNKLFLEKKVKFNFNKKVSIENFFCFSQFEIDSLKKINLNIKNYYIVGNLLFEQYLDFVKTSIEQRKTNLKKYDICLITTYLKKDLLNNSYYYDQVNVSYNKKTQMVLNDPNERKNIIKLRGIIKIIEYTLRFCRENNMRLSIPLKRDKKKSLAYNDEIDFFKENLKEQDYIYFKNNIIEKDNESYSSFEAAINSEVVVSLASTILRDKLGYGGKVLSCNFTGDDLIDFPIKGICLLNNPECKYEEFEKRLIYLY